MPFSFANGPSADIYTLIVSIYDVLCRHFLRTIQDWKVIFLGKISKQQFCHYLVINRQRY